MASSGSVAAPADPTVMIVTMGAVTALTIFLNYFFRRNQKFKRNAQGNTFGSTISGSMALLSNKDSVLSRENVMDSIEGYEKLFSGARKEVGSISNAESIKEREKEYKTMVNSFYDLVTDFYEWGWGQVREQICVG
jgi:sterol 24-C-methyltransferase